MDKNKNLALYGIIGAVLYAVADLFLYVGLEIDSENILSYCHVAEWRLAASMWISLFGSLGLLLGFISLYQLVKVSFGEKAKFIMILPFLAAGGILYCHFVLGVYNPLTYQGAIKAGLSESQIVKILENASEALMPLTLAIVLSGYITEFIVIAGILSGKFGLKKRFLLFMYAGYTVLLLLILLISDIFDVSGLKGGRESLFEITFFLPAFFAWKNKIRGEEA